MIYLLICMIFILIVVVIYLGIGFRQLKSDHDKKVEVLRGMIVELLNSQHLQTDQIRLSEELKGKLAKANHTLSHDIRTMITEFISILSKNNLLEK